MADDNNKPRNAQAKEISENPDTPRKLQQENSIHSERRAGSWLFRAVAPFVAGLAFGCGSPSSYEQDADTMQENADAETENDAPDADRGEDARDTRDAEGSAEDAPLEVEEDAEPEGADVPDSPETVEEAEGTSDVSEDAEPEAGDEAAMDVEVPDGEETEAPDSDAGEADAGCIENVRTVETPTVLPDPVCGSTQTATDIDTVIEWIGADCESTVPTTTRTGYMLTLTPALDTASLGCARCRTTSTVAGDEVLVTVTETSIETANGIACADMTVGDNLDGGATEDKFRLTDVRADQAVGTLFDPAWHLLHNVRVYPTGAPTAIDSSTGLIAADLNAGAATARVCIIELPTIVRNNGDVETWAGHGDFTFNTNVSGPSMPGWGWAR